ncbi:uncharacterized protein LY79DRAFT_558495 [Colletotrichum navitas]|uniref:Uncharacterized protein n=1 Tax=Colletotrichum navitas TaxID=681940 RepID=A0AAD8PVE1_9PEZI|nr:uncharacterized protein LY79DRAFT_558495 [Colletotrichum navitas]KAK1585407.1 hypothetical protein LY79DRAFT_558495 [Colletotrichum navitas]
MLIHSAWRSAWRDGWALCLINSGARAGFAWLVYDSDTGLDGIASSFASLDCRESIVPSWGVPGWLGRWTAPLW